MTQTCSLRSCGVGTAITLLCLALLGFIFWPRKPIVCASIGWEDTKLSTKTTNTELETQLKFKVNVEVENKNWYGINLKDLVVDVYHESAAGDAKVAAITSDKIRVRSGGWVKPRWSAFSLDAATVTSEKTALWLAEAVHKCTKYQVTPFDLKVSVRALGVPFAISVKVNAECEPTALDSLAGIPDAEGFFLKEGKDGSCSDDSKPRNTEATAELDAEPMTVEEYFFGRPTVVPKPDPEAEWKGEAAEQSEDSDTPRGSEPMESQNEGADGEADEVAEEKGEEDPLEEEGPLTHSSVGKVLKKEWQEEDDNASSGEEVDKEVA
uniref:Uncharacterized protein n=1 Tax=Chromera velia CCMP2878 TaxID=1169474 RepID=A0A0G4HWR4_9ALVE|eukprot:Cvel_9099.t1-p1 / transcript=Cvel_9099.t1 / gene=Cvel_9099 / organism=Chromera_velia_CCMP2878 / gene_product=hypothetical protein / transcript_product=hypothetical protein / location=Cvel_scaffold516:76086-77051(+) / protein_length=322 / sequence_SO=supercontig / SO=protein_coding / is_pseudo=false